jgi:hypothetical protein
MFPVPFVAAVEPDIAFAMVVAEFPVLIGESVDIGT